jgi:hypothetical protein
LVGRFLTINSLEKFITIFNSQTQLKLERMAKELYLKQIKRYFLINLGMVSVLDIYFAIQMLE